MRRGTPLESIVRVPEGGKPRRTPPSPPPVRILPSTLAPTPSAARRRPGRRSPPTGRPGEVASPGAAQTAESREERAESREQRADRRQQTAGSSHSRLQTQRCCDSRLQDTAGHSNRTQQAAGVLLQDSRQQDTAGSRQQAAGSRQQAAGSSLAARDGGPAAARSCCRLRRGALDVPPSVHRSVVSSQSQLWIAGQLC